jgi:hypothetical protein
MYLQTGLDFLVEIFFFDLYKIHFLSADVNDELSLDEHLRNQQAFIHGRDAYIYRYIPRVRFLF